MSEDACQQLVDFWFDETNKKMWFNSTPEFDQLLKEKYLHLYEAAVRGELDNWSDSPGGSLALVILFDQIPLNIFRGEKQSFATEARAREVARSAIDRQQDQALDNSQRAFMYMPFMHSEDLAEQEYSVTLYEKADLQDNLRFAQHHRDIIKRFGRFPHRNAILGRESSEEEQLYLQSKQAFHG